MKTDCKVRYNETPTGEQFTAYQQAWDYFNEALFSGSLKPCLLNFSRRTKSCGFFVADKWINSTLEKTHEISLNPDVLLRPVKDIMATLVHEMVHQWQQDHGTPPRRCYHDRQWADKMEAVGLMPSTTGRPGGKRTGQNMAHYVLDGGAFQNVFEAMPTEYLIPWKSAGMEQKKKSKNQNKVKYTCPGCGVNIWGKTALQVVCGDCDEPFEQGE